MLFATNPYLICHPRTFLELVLGINGITVIGTDHLKYIVAYKAMSHAINSLVLTDKNPCINQAIHVLLMHGFCTLHIRILGRHKN